MAYYCCLMYVKLAESEKNIHCVNELGNLILYDKNGNKRLSFQLKT